MEKIANCAFTQFINTGTAITGIAAVLQKEMFYLVYSIRSLKQVSHDNYVEILVYVDDSDELLV